MEKTMKSENRALVSDKKISDEVFQMNTGCFDKATYITEAMKLAEGYHKGQMRIGKSGNVPYYDEHILGVYSILRNECGIEDINILTTALLHDVVEDTPCTFEEIEEKFGTYIMEQVKLLTRIGHEPFAIYAERLFTYGACETVLVKLADRLHNLRTISYMPDKKWIEKKIRQTYTDILAPLPDFLKNKDNQYKYAINQLAAMIEEQLLVVQSETGIKVCVQ
jgi:(p)ppGpp synthase/HD superfamily hydrolase